MELLFSNYPPVKTEYNTFADTFYNLLPKSTEIDIAVGYVSSDSLVELQRLIELNSNIRRAKLIIGMHYIEKFTMVQYNAAVRLCEYLHKTNKGDVRLVTAFRYHGKLYSYSNSEGPFAGIIGSNNLSSIADGGIRVYESSMLIDNAIMAGKIREFINNLSDKSTKSIFDLDITEFKTEDSPLEGQDSVKKLTPRDVADVMSQRTNTIFEIPIKTYEVSPQSNVNVFFGKGRVAKNGVVKPRHWYEVELIVPKEVTSRPGYPQSKTHEAVFDVITDDGWSFKCKVSGDYSKNFRSDGDLRILGKWIKGRLENKGVLTVGDPVKAATLAAYGRNTITLTKTNIPGKWFIDFGV